MGDGGECRRHQFLARVTDDVAKPLIDLQPVAIRSDAGNTDCSVLEDGPETRPAIAKRLDILLTFAQALYILIRPPAKFAARSPIHAPRERLVPLGLRPRALPPSGRRLVPRFLTHKLPFTTISEFAEQLGRCLLTRLLRRISIIPASILCGVVCQEKLYVASSVRRSFMWRRMSGEAGCDLCDLKDGYERTTMSQAIEKADSGGGSQRMRAS
jgi:hypothetical protein